MGIDTIAEYEDQKTAELIKEFSHNTNIIDVDASSYASSNNNSKAVEEKDEQIKSMPSMIPYSIQQDRNSSETFRIIFHCSSADM